MSASVVCRQHLQIVWIHIRPNKISDLIWIQTNRGSDDIPDDCFNFNFEKNQQMTKKCPHLQIVVLFSRTKVKLYFAIANALRLRFNPVQCKCFQRCMIFYEKIFKLLADL